MKSAFFHLDMDVTKLPAVIVSKVLAELDWMDKLNSVRAILSWQSYLETHCAWPTLTYNPKIDKVLESTSFGNDVVNIELITSLLFCVEKYGKYMKRLSVEIVQSDNLTIWEFQLFEAILKNCNNLRYFEVTQNVYVYKPYLASSDQTCWMPILTKTYLDILKTKKLSEARLSLPKIDWSYPDCNPFVGIINGNLQEKITVLKFSSDSLEGYTGALTSLAKFRNLRILEVKWCCINCDIIDTLASNNLKELSLYQEEDILELHSNENKKEFWKRIVKKSPDFSIDLELKCVIVLKDHFPFCMPLRKLYLDELQTSITKGLLDDIVSKYNSTLQVFSYKNSSLTANTDTRMEQALIDMVRKCARLQELEYEFAISSSTVLCLANECGLKRLRILRVEVSYNFDPKNSCYLRDQVQWLRENSQDEESLQKAVSKLMGSIWTLSERSKYEHAITNFY